MFILNLYAHYVGCLKQLALLRSKKAFKKILDFKIMSLLILLSFSSHVFAGKYDINAADFTINGWASPLSGGVLTTHTWYDYDSSQYLINHGFRHGAYDFVDDLNASVFAIDDGVVKRIDRKISDTYNLSIIFVQHETSTGKQFLVLYGHVYALSSLNVGDSVKKGQQIGLIKRAGSPDHIHFGISTIPSDYEIALWGGIKSGITDPVGFLKNNSNIDTPIKLSQFDQAPHFLARGNSAAIKFTLQNTSESSTTVEDITLAVTDSSGNNKGDLMYTKSYSFTPNQLVSFNTEITSTLVNSLAAGEYALIPKVKQSGLWRHLNFHVLEVWTEDMATYASQGIIRSDSEMFKEERRDTFIAILIRALEKRAGRTLASASTSQFTDTSTDQTGLRAEILKAEQLGIIAGGGSGLFYPARTISRAEALAFTVRTFEALARDIIPQCKPAFADFPTEENKQWMHEVMQKGYSQYLTNGYGSGDARVFKPENTVNRVEAVAFVENLIKQLMNPSESREETATTCWDAVEQNIDSNEINNTQEQEMPSTCQQSRGLILPVVDDDPNDGKSWSVFYNNFGNFYPAYDGHHPGEDWNYGNKYDDLGKPAYAIAEGKVIKKTELSEPLGYAIVLEHTGSFIIPAKNDMATYDGANKGDKRYPYNYSQETVNKIYSVYVHVDNIDSSVAVGKVIPQCTRIGDIIDSGNGPHLHFEIRSEGTQHSNGGSMAGNSSNWVGGVKNANGYYINLQQMVDAGFRDPRDVISANNRPPVFVTVADKQLGKALLIGVQETELGSIKVEGKTIIDITNTQDGIEFNVGVTQSELIKPLNVVVLDKQGKEVLNTYYPFSDVKPSQWYTNAIIQLWKANIIDGYDNGTFKVGKSIKRAELLKLALLALGHAPLVPTNTSFTDVDSTHWGSGYINYALSKTIISNNTTFRPDDPITRAETAKIFAKTLSLANNLFSLLKNWGTIPDVCGGKIFTDLKPGEWYCEFIEQVYKHKLMKGSGSTFKPQDELSREEAAMVACRAYFYQQPFGNLQSCEQ